MNSDINTMITEEDINQMNQINKIRKDLMSYIGIENFIEFMVDIIDKTEGIEFKSEIARKYIDKNKPVFVVTMPDLEIDMKQIKNMFYLDKLNNDVTNFINNNVISKLSKYFYEAIESNLELKEAYESLASEVRNISFMNIYSIRINAEKNIINFEYIL